MTIPNRVRACAERLAHSGGSLHERLADVTVRGLCDARLFGEIREASRLWQDGGFGTVVALDALGDDVDLPTTDSFEGEIRLVIHKRRDDVMPLVLTRQGLQALLADPPRIAAARRVRLAADFAPFAAVSCRFEPWADQPASEPEPHRLAHIVPRRIVRDQLALAPLSIGPFLIEQPPVETSAIYSAWQSAACRQLLMSLCNEIWQEDGEIRVALHGPRTRKLPVEPQGLQPDRDFAALTEATRWVYDSGRDVEARHTLFTYELAREWPQSVPFAEAFSSRAPDALDAAKNAFRMHVQGAAKETLSALQDLRRNLADDVGRLVQHTRDLATSLWRDFLIALAALLGRIMMLAAAPDIRELWAAKAVLIGTALYLAFSLFTTLAANARFMQLAEQNRMVWRSKIYGFLEDSDYQALASTPLGAATRTYRRIRLAVAAAYLLLVTALLAVALWPRLLP